jgi:hypothetical protein
MKWPTTIALAYVFAGPARATHLSGAELSYIHLGGNTYDVVLETYIWDFVPADTPWWLVDLGDGTTDSLVLDTSEIVLNSACSYIHIDRYMTTHTYMGPGVYHITAELPNRNSNTINIPGAVNIPLCAAAILVIDPLLGPNNSVQFQTRQTIGAYLWGTWEHHPMPVDPDQDSMAFEVVVPLGGGCDPILPYFHPTEIAPGPNNTQWLDLATGSYYWAQPQLMGRYVVAIRCTEYRNGTMIGQVTRDMSICIYDPFNGVEEMVSEKPTLLQTASQGVYSLSMDSNEAAAIEAFDTSGRLQRAWAFLRHGSTIDLRSLSSGSYALLVTRSSGQHSIMRVAFVH